MCAIAIAPSIGRRWRIIAVVAPGTFGRDHTDSRSGAVSRYRKTTLLTAMKAIARPTGTRTDTAADRGVGNPESGPLVSSLERKFRR